MNFAYFEEMYKMLWEFIYKVLEIFGITKDANGNLTEAE